MPGVRDAASSEREPGGLLPGVQPGRRGAAVPSPPALPAAPGAGEPELGARPGPDAFPAGAGWAPLAVGGAGARPGVPVLRRHRDPARPPRPARRALPRAPAGRRKRGDAVRLPPHRTASPMVRRPASTHPLAVHTGCSAVARSTLPPARISSAPSATREAVPATRAVTSRPEELSNAVTASPSRTRSTGRGPSGVWMRVPSATQ